MKKGKSIKESQKIAKLQTNRNKHHIKIFTRQNTVN